MRKRAMTRRSPRNPATCSHCGQKKNHGAFKRSGEGVCRACVKKAEEMARRARAVVPAPALLTIDVSTGRDPNGTHAHGERIVRVQRLNGLVRLMAGVRLDETAISHVRNVYRAASIYRGPASGARKARRNALAVRRRTAPALETTVTAAVEPNPWPPHETRDPAQP